MTQKVARAIALPQGRFRKSPTKARPHTDDEYLAWDPYAGDKGRDECVRNLSSKLVVTRRPHSCLALFGEQHAIPSGTRARREKCIYDGKWRTWYACLDCIAKDLDEWAEL